MFWHPRAEAFAVPASQGTWLVPPNKTALVQHGGLITIINQGESMQFSTQNGPLWLRPGSQIAFQNAIAGLLLPTDFTG